MPPNIEAIADILDDARRGKTAIQKITIDHPDVTIGDGYRIQKELCRRRIEEGLVVAGYKMGLTSIQKMKQMNVESPIYGVLFAETQVLDGGVVSLDELIHPMVEPEVAFVLGKELSGPHCTVENVMDATERIAAAIEIIDSRYQNYQFDLPSVIADNTSAGRFVVSAEGIAPKSIDLANLSVVIEKNGIAAAKGNSSAVLGNPALSVAMLANMLAEDGIVLAAGSVVMSGGITAATAVVPGDEVVCTIGGLGNATVHFA